MIQKKCLLYKEINNAESRVGFLGKFEQAHEVKIFNRNKVEITEYDQILPDCQAVITLKFQWEKKFEEVEEKTVVYYLPRSNDWEIVNGMAKTKKGRRAEFDKAKKDIHKKLLKEKFKGDLFGVDKKNSLGSTNIQYGITSDDRNKKIELHFYKKGDNNATMHFDENQITIEVKYLQTKEFSDKEGGEVIEETEKKTPWTKGWIAFLTILGIILLLGIIFWKKIWRWFKGEREQEKKVREQIDIF